jgi:hypothetical protein
MEALQRLSNYLAHQMRLLDEQIDHYLLGLDNERSREVRTHLKWCIRDAKSQMKALNREYETVHTMIRDEQQKRLARLSKNSWFNLLPKDQVIHNG